MCLPRYQDIPPEDIPVVDVGGGVTVKAIAGRVVGADGRAVEGAVDTGATEPTLLGHPPPAGGTYAQPLPPAHNAFVYVHEGRVGVGPADAETPLDRGRIGVLGPGRAARLAAPDGPAKALLVAGRPLGEPIVRHGPFVMNTRDEIRQAVEDYMAGRF
ncbi:MAG: pirin-like C-terminal cupin domain-containing protein [Alphaproteobacteria bacterium]